MTIDRKRGDDRQARIDAMIEEIRAAQQRQLVSEASACGIVTKPHNGRWSLSSLAS